MIVTQTQDNENKIARSDFVGINILSSQNHNPFSKCSCSDLSSVSENSLIGLKFGTPAEGCESMSS